MVIDEIVKHFNILIPIVGFCVLLVIGGAIWALRQIRNELKREFVTKEHCNQCTIEIKDRFHHDIDKKYDRLEEQIKYNREERLREIKELATTNARLESKVDMILTGIGIKKS